MTKLQQTQELVVKYSKILTQNMENAHKTTDGSIINNNLGYEITFRTEVIEFVKLIDQNTIFTYEAFAFLRTLLIISKRSNKDSVIYSVSLSSLTAIKN